MTTDYTILYLLGAVILFVFSKDVWIKTNRNHTEIAEDYWNSEYLDYSDKPLPMGDMR